MPRLTLATRFRMPADVVLQEVAGETVLLHLKTERYFGLDEVGTTMLSALRAAGTAQAAYDAALDAYDVQGPQLESDLLALLNELLQHGLVELAA